jgi:putative transposase
MLDIYSRYCPGWMVVDQEEGQVAKAWLKQRPHARTSPPATLTIHADRGGSMTPQPVAVLLANPNIGRTHSRPHMTNDTPHSEAGFKTLKQSPAFPERFGWREDAIEFCTAFFEHHSHFHRHLASACIRLRRCTSVPRLRSENLGPVFSMPLMRPIPSGSSTDSRSHSFSSKRRINKPVPKEPAQIS